MDGWMAHRIVRALKVKEHFSDKDAPALLSMPVFHFRQPTLYRRFIIFLAEQKFRRVPPLYVLQHLYPILHRRDTIRRQVVGFLPCCYLKRGSTLRPIYPVEKR